MSRIFVQPQRYISILNKIQQPQKEYFWLNTKPKNKNVKNIDFIILVMFHHKKVSSNAEFKRDKK